jgi:hypothetical protein
MKNPCGKKSWNKYYLYVDIASLKFIVRKLFKAKLTYKKEYCDA